MTIDERDDAGTITPPTPSKTARALGAEAAVAAVKFSVKRGFYEAPFQLELSCATPGATIYYTTNSSSPGGTNGCTYLEPLTIGGTTPVRAMATKAGFEPSAVETLTYLFLEDVVRQRMMDSQVAGQNGTDLYGGKYTRTIKDDLRSLPTLSLVSTGLFGKTGIYSNPNEHGEEWERAVSVELIYPQGEKGFQIDAGVRIHGSLSRTMGGAGGKLPLALFFRERYGQGKLHYPLFGDAAADRFDCLVLRAPCNDGYTWAGAKALFIRDAFALATAQEMGLVASHATFVHLYLNGIYWGLYSPVERPDAAFLATYRGGEKEEWDCLNGIMGITNPVEVKAGDLGAWNRLLALAKSGLAAPADYQWIQGNHPDGTPDPAGEDLLDVDNLIDYMILNFYLSNGDWPDNNWYAGRKRVGGEGFQFYPWDSEYTVGIVTPTNYDNTQVSFGVAAPFASCRKNAEFQLRFADHVYRHFFNHGALFVNPANPHYDPTRAEDNRPAGRFDELCARVSPAVVAESARWGARNRTPPATRDEDWQRERTNELAHFFPFRSGIVLGQLRDGGLYPLTEPPGFSRHGGNVPPGFALTMTAPAGRIYYTTDGSDPRLPVAATETFHLTLVSNLVPKRALVPSTNNGGSLLGTKWTGGAEPFDDAHWIGGTGGVGYGGDANYQALIHTDVRTMTSTGASSVFIRVPFELAPADLTWLSQIILRIRYDDGFAAFLNGKPIVSVNAPGTLKWDSSATAIHEGTDALALREFRAGSPNTVLRAGANVLAIQGLNFSTNTAGFLIDAELIGSQWTTNAAAAVGQIYTGPVPINSPVTIKARVLNGTEWSALHEATFSPRSPPLSIEAWGLDGSQLWLRFQGVAGRTYSVYSRDSLAAYTQRLEATILPPSTNGPVEMRVAVPAAGAVRFYQISATP